MVQAMSGLMSLTGDPDGPPYRAGISVFDVMAGLHTAIAILAALQPPERHRRGPARRGSACMASALSGMVNQTSAYAAGGVVPFRMGNSHPSLFPYEPLPTADGDLIVTAGNDAQFRKLCEVIGAPELADDPRFATNPGRTANRDELRPLLAEKLAAKSAAEWFDELIAVGRAVRADQHRGRGHRVRARRSGWSRSSPRVRGDATADGPAPDHLLQDARPATRSPRPRSTSTARRSAPGSRVAVTRTDDQGDDPEYPHLARHLRRRHASPCSARTWPTT